MKKILLCVITLVCSLQAMEEGDSILNHTQRPDSPPTITQYSSITRSPSNSSLNEKFVDASTHFPMIHDSTEELARQLYNIFERHEHISDKKYHRAIVEFITGKKCDSEAPLLYLQTLFYQSEEEKIILKQALISTSKENPTTINKFRETFSFLKKDRDIAYRLLHRVSKYITTLENQLKAARNPIISLPDKPTKNKRFSFRKPTKSEFFISCEHLLLIICLFIYLDNKYQLNFFGSRS